MAQATYQALNFVKQALETAYIPGGGFLAVPDGAAFGSPTPAAPLLLTAFAQDAPTIPLFNLRITGRTADLLTVDAITWGTEVTLDPGDLVALTPAAEIFDELKAAVNGKAEATHDHDDRYYTDAEVDGALASKAPLVHVHAAGDITSGVIAPARLATGTPDASNYVRGDGTWAPGPVGPAGPAGPEGPGGPEGDPGPAGVGVPAGGTTGQVLSKASGTDYDTQWATSSGGGGVSDGDKGDITVSGGGATWMIDPSAVTLDKLADLPANAVIARALNTAGPPASLASSANGQILTRAADTLGWGSLDLGSAAAVSGVLTPDNGGTGLTAYTKGDLVAAANANTLLQLSAGTNGQILRANSASPLGLQWVDGGSHVLYFAQNTGLTVQNTTTESTLVATGAGSPTVAATKLVANDVFRWRIGGYFSSPGTSPGTAIHRLRINGTQILSTNAQNIPTGVSQLHWSIESWITIRTIGSSGQVVGNMLVILVGGTSTTIAPRLWATVPPVTIDMSVSITFDYTIEMSSALVTNIWQSTNGTLERLRVLV